MDGFAAIHIYDPISSLRAIVQTNSPSLPHKGLTGWREGTNGWCVDTGGLQSTCVRARLGHGHGL